MRPSIIEVPALLVRRKSHRLQQRMNPRIGGRRIGQVKVLSSDCGGSYAIAGRHHASFLAAHL